MSQLYYPIQNDTYEKRPMVYTKTELPPTPSSSSLSIFVNDHKEPTPESFSESSLRMPSTSSHYGSLSTDFSYTRTNSISTVSPNDDDESLYLLWTHQLLREKGYQPSSCKLDDDDSYSIDSSITNMSQPKPNQLDRPWWKSCFPMC